MAEITEVPPHGRRKSPMRELLETIALAVVIALVVRTFVVEVYRVQGSSMESTMHHGERVLVNKFSHRWIRQPVPGDIIIFQYPRQPDKDFIKRVVAVAGDRFRMEEGKVYVNDRLLPEAPTVLATDSDYEEIVVPPDSVWVLGDNRNNSQDSRDFEEVPLENIRGMAFMRIWPLTRICFFVNPVEAAESGSWGLLPCR